jgi:hypothetical protein
MAGYLELILCTRTFLLDDCRRATAGARLPCARSDGDMTTDIRHRTLSNMTTRTPDAIPN